MENTESGTGSRATFPRAAILAAAVLVAGAGCTSGSPDPTPNPSPTFRPVTSIQDIMLSVIDPSADAIWESVATIITYEGTEERRPARTRTGCRCDTTPSGWSKPPTCC